MVQRSQYGTAKVKERETGRPLLVLLFIAAAGIVFFLWMQDDSIEPVVTADAEATEQVVETSAAPKAAEAAASHDSGLEDWWYDVESPIYDAFASTSDAEGGDCDSLEYAVEDLGAKPSRPEAPIASAFGNLVRALDRAVAACRSQNAATVRGSTASARTHLNALKSAAKGYGLPDAQMLEGL